MTTTRIIPPKAANDNTHPVLQWTRLLHKVARRLEPRAQDREDLVQETIAMCLERWASYNPAESLPGWLIFNMRECRANLRRQGRVRTTSLEDCFSHPSEPPRQHHTAELSQAMDRLGTRNGSFLLRFAMGESTPDIAAETGLSKQRVHQIIKQERNKLEAA